MLRVWDSAIGVGSRRRIEKVYLVLGFRLNVEDLDFKTALSRRGNTLGAYGDDIGMGLVL